MKPSWSNSVGTLTQYVFRLISLHSVKHTQAAHICSVFSKLYGHKYSPTAAHLDLWCRQGCGRGDCAGQRPRERAQEFPANEGMMMMLYFSGVCPGMSCLITIWSTVL